MSTTTKRNYRATFILDNRGKEDSVDQIIDGVKKDILAVDGEVGAHRAGLDGECNLTVPSAGLLADLAGMAHLRLLRYFS